MTSNRDPSLDGIRGIAAIAVYFSHVAALFWISGIDAQEPSGIVRQSWNLGAPAVDLFFVLSGFVLTGAIIKTTPFRYGPYIMARLVRLLPIAWAGVLAGLVLRMIAARFSKPDGAGMAIDMLLEPVAPAQWLGMATMLFPTFNADSVNPPLWTLPIEITASLLLPVFVYLAPRFRWWIIAGAVAVGWPLSAWTGMSGFGLSVPFALGVVIRIQEEDFQRLLPYPVLLVGLTVLMSRSILGIEIIQWRWVTMWGAALVILAVRRGAARGVLSSPTSQFLGRISYPFYALHYPVLTAGVILLAPDLSILTAALVMFPVALMAAWMAALHIDRPAVEASRRLLTRYDQPQKTKDAVP